MIKDDAVWGWLGTVVGIVSIFAIILGTMTVRTELYVKGGYCEHKIVGMGESIYWSKPPICGVQKP